MKADKEQIVPSSDLDNSSSSECTYSIWIYIDDLNFNSGKKKVILHHGSSGSTDGFNLYLDEYGNNLVANSLMIKTPDDGYEYTYNSYVNPAGNQYIQYGSYTGVLGISGNYAQGDNEATIQKTCGNACNSEPNCIGYNYGQNIGGCMNLKYKNPEVQVDITDFTPTSGYNNFAGIKSKTFLNTCKVSKIPTQKWVNVIVSLSSVSVDMYIDGKLVKTCLTNGKPVSMGDQNVYISPGGIGFSGWNAKFEYWAKYMEPQEIWKIYKTGFEKTFNFGNYQLNMSIYKGDVEKASFTI